MSTPTMPTQSPRRPAGEPQRRGMRAALGVSRPPRALAALLALTAIVGVAWAFVTPLFQAPDEHAHFGYVQTLAERFALPGDVKRLPLSSEQSLAGSLSNADQAAQQLPVRMEWSERAYERWRQQAAALPPTARTDGGGPNPASSNPPLYYLYEAVPYRLVHGADIITRVQVARLASVVWMLFTVLGVWLLAGEFFGRDRLLQLAAAGTAGLLPMIGFVSASVTPDAMLFAAWSFALWLGVRILRRGVTPAAAFAFFAIVGGACLVKATSFALVPAAVFVVVVALLRARGAAGRSRAGAVAATSAGGLVATLGAWFALARLLDRPAAAQVSDAAGGSELILREFASYLWQFYLPKLPFQTAFPIPGANLPVHDIWVKTGWAGFGWLEVRFPDPVYVALGAATLIVVLAGLLSLWRGRRGVDLAVLAFFAIAGLALLAGLHWTEYQMLTAGRGPFNAGRYLLPLAGLAGLAVAQALRLLRPRGQAGGAAAVLSLLFVLNLFSLGLMLERFYA